jgi:NAD(P)-dependent dehydrogenase (short-subunit alcohol dehydrogenase family)
MVQAAPRGVALVTGGAKRIGRALCLAVAKIGFDVAIHHRGSGPDAQSLITEIEALGRRAEAFPADLSREDEIQALIPTVAQRMGPVTLLINNASLFHDDRVGSLSRASWDAHMQTNLRAPLVLAEGLAAQLPLGQDGQIINLLDQRVLKPNPQFFTYSLTKAALWHATKTLAQALAPHIRVNGVGPGPTLASIHQDDETFSAEAANTLLQKHADPQQIAAAVLYLIDAASVTGQMIAVDGGQHLAWHTADIIGD